MFRGVITMNKIFSMASGIEFMVLILFVQCLAAGTNRLLHVESDLAHKADANEMQFGTVTLYFEREPVVNSPVSKGSCDQVVFFFPQTTCPRDMQATLAKTFGSRSEGDYISLRCEHVKKPIEGIQLTVLCNDAKVVIDRTQVRSFQLKPGIMFNFYNKELLNTVKNKTKSLLYLSYVHSCVYWPYLFV